MKKLPETRITNREQLKRRISELSAQMEEKELQLQSDLKQVHESLRATNLIRNAVKDLSEQPDLRVGIGQAAADIGAHVLIDRIMYRKNLSVVNYLFGFIFKKIADHFILREKNKNATY